MAIEPEPVKSIEAAVKLPDGNYSKCFIDGQNHKKRDDSNSNTTKLKKKQQQFVIAHTKLTFAWASLFP